MNQRRKERAMSDIKINTPLYMKAQNVFNAMNEFMEERNGIFAPKGTIWIEDTSGRVLIFTKGEQRNELMKNIDQLDDTKYFERLEGEASNDQP